MEPSLITNLYLLLSELFGFWTHCHDLSCRFMGTLHNSNKYQRDLLRLGFPPTVIGQELPMLLN